MINANALVLGKKDKNILKKRLDLFPFGKIIAKGFERKREKADHCEWELRRKSSELTLKADRSTYERTVEKGGREPICWGVILASYFLLYLLIMYDFH